MKDEPLIKYNKELNKLKSMKMGGYEYLVNSRMGYYPYFATTVRNRVRQKKAVNVACTGEGGISKSYICNDICRVISPKYFNVECVVFTYVEFMRFVNIERMGVPIVFDEPSYAMSKRDWYNEINKALTKTIESFRFKVHPLFIPVINKNLIDKDIRTYLLQYHITMRDRGKGTVYRLYPSQIKEGKVYQYEMCKIDYDLFDNNLCSIPSCLGCKKLDPKNKDDRCMIFRAQYERKKALTQEERYEKALEDAEKKESKNLSDEEIEVKLLTIFDKFYDKEKKRIDVEIMATLGRREFGINLGHNKKYRVAKMIKYDYPQHFNIEDDEEIPEKP